MVQLNTGKDRKVLWVLPVNFNPKSICKIVKLLGAIQPYYTFTDTSDITFDFVTLETAWLSCIKSLKIKNKTL